MTPEQLISQVSGLEVIENNIERILGLEIVTAKRVEALYRRVFDKLDREIRSKSLSKMGEEQARVVNLQLQESLNALALKRRVGAEKAFVNVRDMAGHDTVKEFNALNKRLMGMARIVPIDAVILSTDPESYLFNRYVDSFEAFDSQAASSIERSLSESIVRGDSYTAAAGRLSTLFRTMDYWKLARIARTEMHNIFNLSKIESMKQIRKDYVPGLKKMVIHPMDHRTGEDSKYFKSLDQVIPLDASFEYTWNGQKRVTFSGNDRPNDRGVLVPASPDWLK